MSQRGKISPLVCGPTCLQWKKETSASQNMVGSIWHRGAQTRHLCSPGSSRHHRKQRDDVAFARWPTGCVSIHVPADVETRPFFFFCASQHTDGVHTKSTHEWLCLTDHLVHRRDHAVATNCCKVKEGQSKRLRGCATQQLLPSPEPRSSTVALQVLGEFRHLGPSELTKEIRSFIGPSTANLCRQHDETRPAPFSSKLRCVCGPAPRLPRPWWLHLTWLHLAWHFRPCAKVTPLCQWLTAILRREGARPPPLPAVCHPHGVLWQVQVAHKNVCGPWLHLLCTLWLQLTPTPNFSVPTPLLLRKLHGGGQGRQVDDRQRGKRSLRREHAEKGQD